MTKQLQLGEVEKFKQRTLDEYKRGISFISNFSTTLLKEHEFVPDNTAGFVKIARRPLVNREIFLRDTGKTYVSPTITGLGTSISRGEKKYLIEKVESTIEQVEELDWKKAIKKINSSKNLVFIDFELYSQLRLKSPKTTPFGSEERIIFTPSKILGNKMILVNPATIQISRITYYDELSEKFFNLNFEIGKYENKRKIDVLVHSSLKVEARNDSKNRKYSISLLNDD